MRCAPRRSYRDMKLPLKPKAGNLSTVPTRTAQSFVIRNNMPLSKKMRATGENRKLSIKRAKPNRSLQSMISNPVTQPEVRP